MRLIDADRIEYEQNEDYKDDYTGKTYQYSYVRKENIDKMPTIEAEPVKHGKWIFKNGYLGNTYYCSECNLAVYLNKFEEPNLTDFCPDCGARMDGGEEDEDD